MTEPLIEIKDAVVSYREGYALRGVSLRVMPGEYTVIIGPNGAGKTTLLTVINGLTRLAGGEARVLGMAVGGRNNGRIRARVGYVAQIHNIDPRLPITVRESVMVGRYAGLGLLRRPGAPDREKVNAVISMVGLSALADRPLGHLSGGERQKTAIARALAQEPRVLLLDEPTASLDRQAQKEILSLVRTVHNSRSMATLYVTHDLETVPRNSDRVILMKNGRIWREGPPDQVLTEVILNELYAGATPVHESALAMRGDGTGS